MKQKIFVALFVVVCFALFAVSITLYNCHRANVMLRKTVISQANEISELHASGTTITEDTEIIVARRLSPKASLR